MPWNARTFKRHNQRLTDGQASHAARVANAILESTGDEAKAIRIANAKAKEHHDPMEHGFDKVDE